MTKAVADILEIFSSYFVPEDPLSEEKLFWHSTCLYCMQHGEPVTDLKLVAPTRREKAKLDIVGGKYF